MDQDKPRLRKEHRKSRDGCSECKRRRTRCDERKPIWYLYCEKRYLDDLEAHPNNSSNCLVRGGMCYYAVRDNTNQQPLRALRPSSVDFDPFDSLPVKFTKNSKDIFRYLKSFRLLSQTRAPSAYRNQGVSQEALCYHNGIVMAAMHYSWLRGSYKEIEETYLFHKLEIIHAVNESISESSPMAQTGIVEAISQLSMSEAGVGETAASQVHLDGLVMVFNQGTPDERQRYQRYWEIQQHLMLVMGAFMAAARKVKDEGESSFSLTFASRSGDDNQETRTQSELTSSSTPSYNKYLTPSLTPNSPAAWAAASYLYLNLICFDGEWVPGGHGNPRLLRWLLDWVQVRLDNDSYDLATRSYTGELWLWRVAVGAYALTVAGSMVDVRDLDENVDHGAEGRKEMADIRQWYTEQLSKRRRATWVTEWEDSKQLLDKILWLQFPGSTGELVLEQAWQRSM